VPPRVRPAVSWTADPEAAEAPPTQPVPSRETPTPRLAASAIEVPSIAIGPVPAAPAKGKARKDLPLAGFDEELEKLIANHQDEWEEDTASDVRVLVGVFRGILAEHDVTHSGEITQEHVAALRQHFNHILPHWGRSPRLRSLDPPPLNGSTLKYGFDHEGGPQWQTSDTSPTRSSRSFGRLRF